MAMLPLSRWPAPERCAVIGVFTDIDDTLTTEGAITADALAALGQLKDAGLHVVAITGRPVGWSMPFARSWPVDAVVAENGAVALVKQHASTMSPGAISVQPDDTLTKLHFLPDAQQRAANFTRMQQVAQRVVREVPGATLSQDSPGRETDIAIDHSEFARLSSDRIAQVVQILRQEGMQATVSSIHINGWFGAHDKLSGAHWIVRELYGRELAMEIERWVYVGDSTNDQSMFQAFVQSVGVANIRRFASELRCWPRYVTPCERGAGFAEVASALLSARSGLPGPADASAPDGNTTGGASA